MKLGSPHVGGHHLRPGVLDDPEFLKDRAKADALIRALDAAHNRSTKRKALRALLQFRAYSHKRWGLTTPDDSE